MNITHDTFEHGATRWRVLGVLATAALACLILTALSVMMSAADAPPARSEAVSAASAGGATCAATKDEPGC